MIRYAFLIHCDERLGYRATHCYCGSGTIFGVYGIREEVGMVFGQFDFLFRQALIKNTLAYVRVFFLFKIGSVTENRTPVDGMKIRCPNH